MFLPCFSQGFLNLQWTRWKRVAFTRLVAILPTFCIAYYSNIDHLSNMNDILNAVMSLQLPFAIIPVVAFTSNSHIMGDFVNGMYVSDIILHQYKVSVVKFHYIHPYFFFKSFLYL